MMLEKELASNKENIESSTLFPI